MSEGGGDVYPAGEHRAAWIAATQDGHDVPRPEHFHESVRALERLGYLPRDRDRVARIVAAATRYAERAMAERERAAAHAAAVDAGDVIDLTARRATRSRDTSDPSGSIPDAR